MKVRWARVLTVLPIIAGAWLITSSSPAVAANHGTAGTYQVFVHGQPFGTVVLGRNHLVAPYDAASWSIQKDVVTVTSLGPILPLATCLHYRQAFPCQITATFTGRKTSDGIASRSAQGLYTVNVGAAVMYWSFFYAVRTGGTHQAGQ